MALVPGVRLGHYEVLAPLGAGGMGEVYRARDTRLDRTVALKVLPAHLSADAGLKRRLEREARAISQLSHPHICTLYDVGREGETDFLVMEYLEGETLAQRLERGPLPLEQSLRTAGEIADALDKAHRQGVVHRDLKPGNVMLTKSGAKLLDFGLARLGGTLSPDEVKDESALPTQQRPLTEEGKVVGTYPYMAPEQLEGRAADARTDIFAFGAVLYEMVTGRRAFEGRSRASLIAAILSSEPRPISELQPMTPRLLDRVLKRCLAKDPDERWQSAGDLASELRWVAEGMAGAGAAASPGRAAWKTWSLVLAGVGIALVAGVAGSLVRTPAAPPPPAPVVRVSLPLAADEVLAFAENFPLGAGRPSLALSPDGSSVAFVVVEGASTRIRVRRMADAVSAPLGGTEGGFDPFFSPDGQWLAFFTADKLKKVSLRGGEAATLCDAANPFGGAWGEDDRIVFAAQEGQRLMRVSVAGGRPEVLRTVFANYWPQFLPGSKALLLSATAAESTVTSRNPDDFSLLAFFPETGETKPLLQGGTFGRYVSTGHLLYARGGAVHAVPFDARRVAVTGAARPVLDGVRVEVRGAAQIACSRDGTLVYVPGQSMIQSELAWIDRGGRVTPVGFPPQPFGTFQLSPDGRRLAIVVQERRQEVWIYDLERGTRTKLAPEGDSGRPVWTRDGARITYASTRDGSMQVYWKAADGSGDAERLTKGNEQALPESWSPDGRLLALSAHPTSAVGGVWTLAMDGPREARAFLDTPTHFEWGANISPDGRWLAYTSDSSGRYEVHLQPFPSGGRDWTLSTDGGEEPIWSPRADELFYRNGDRWMVVPVSLGTQLAAGKPRQLFRGSFFNASGRSYDVDPDARRFLVLRPVVGETRLQQPQLILNWFTELRQKMAEGSK